MDKFKYRLGDPQSSFEVEPGGKKLSGSGVFTLEETPRIKQAKRLGILVSVRDDGGTNSGPEAVTFIPPIADKETGGAQATPADIGKRSK